MTYKKIFCILMVTIVAYSACKRYLPENKDSFDIGASYTSTSFTPVLGRTTEMAHIFYPGNSNMPFTFKIVNARNYDDGSPAEIFNDTFPVKVWKDDYTGTETSLAEIEAKREIQYRPFFEVREHSGDFIMWNSAKTPYVTSFPDSGYIFDVEVSNLGGRKYFRDLRLMPYKERPFEPSNLDPVTGQATTPDVSPYQAINIYGETSKQYIYSNQIAVFFNKVSDTGNTLSFQFRDTLFHSIDPSKFADTDWGNLIHGFNRKMTDSSVTYDVAYPIPLTNLITKYTTSDGTMAHVDFKYHRQGIGNVREDASLQLNFSIYESGTWQIVFWFKNDNPKFEDE